MKKISHNFVIVIILLIMASCKTKEKTGDINIIFLHHSTGEIIWNGTASTFMQKALKKVSGKLLEIAGPKALLPTLFEKYNEESNKNYKIKELTFPKENPYGWKNFPYDYYNIWVMHAGEQLFMEEPTLEILTKDYQVIIFKHCFPVSNIQADLDSADINSDYKTLSNYKLQYLALRNKLYQFPDAKFIICTGAAQTKENITEDKAIRAKEFFNWVVDEWDVPDDNIYLWDFYILQTEGGLYFKDEYAMSSQNSHPNTSFAQKTTPLLFRRIVDVIENDGRGTEITGKQFSSISE